MSESGKLARAVRPGPLFSLCALKQKTARHRNWDEISSKVFLYIRILDILTILVYLFKNLFLTTQVKENIISGLQHTKGRLETRLHIFLADQLTLYQPGGVDYAPHLGVCISFWNVATALHQETS